MHLGNNQTKFSQVATNAKQAVLPIVKSRIPCVTFHNFCEQQRLFFSSVKRNFRIETQKNSILINLVCALLK